MINVIDGRGKDINWITGKLNRRSSAYTGRRKTRGQ